MSLTGDEGAPENLVNAYIAENIDLDDIDIHITGRMSTLTVLSELIVQSRLLSIAISLVMGWLDIPLDSATVLIASIAVGIGIDYSIHYINHYRTARTSGMIPEAAPETAPEFEAYSGSDGLTAYNIMKDADTSLIPTDIRAEVTMTLINRAGSRRVREIAMISKEEDNPDKLVMHFRSPPEVKGTGFLMLESEAKSSTVSARRS